MDDYTRQLRQWTGRGYYGNSTEEVLASLAESADDDEIAALLGGMIHPTTSGDLRRLLLIMLGQRGTPAAVQAIEDFEEWATGRGVSLRPPWTVDRDWQRHFVSREANGRWWSVFSWNGWTSCSWWVTWSTDGTNWAPAGHLYPWRFTADRYGGCAEPSDGPYDELLAGYAWDATAAELCRRLGVRGEQALAGFDVAWTDEAVRQRFDENLAAWRNASHTVNWILAEMTVHKGLAYGPPPRVGADDAAVLQAMWLVGVCVRQATSPSVLLAYDRLSTVPLRGNTAEIVRSPRLVNGIGHHVVHKLEYSTSSLAVATWQDWSSFGSSAHYEVTVERKHGRWVVTRWKLACFS